MSKKTLNYSLFIFGIFILFGFLCVKLYQNNLTLKSSLPALLKGEKIKYFELVGMDADRINHQDINQDKPVLIFIFSRPCSPCNKNLRLWNRMAEILKERTRVFGITLEDITDAYNFSEKTRLKFKIYVPENKEKFITKIRIKLNLPQTIVYHKGVKYIKLGNLKGEDAVMILNLVKSLKT